ncbi:toprim domain-containing protein [Methylomarinum sp. Ch1-1]|uniref:Toprim domain-containing protein n=1 Tax=Methylomarinum roseum TaxID=3067653 RepID=A0AAU7NT01_9GAMM|nr:toprim domain-containing protein [Methylomarinum sp. Ch1-1]MDP4519913.1 toprim domain-containing protein [Methylomarinum sp. Ch1-1]
MTDSNEACRGVTCAETGVIDKSGLENVIEQMLAVGLTGLTERDLIVDGALHRFRPDWEPKKNKKRAWYVLFPFRLDDGKELVAGSFGWFKGAETFSYNVGLQAIRTFSKEERRRYAAEQERKRIEAEQERQSQIEETAQRAAEIWAKLPCRGRSAYLQRKKVAAFNTRFTRGSIVLPVYGFDKKLTGLQFIDGDGNKKFLTGTVKKGRFCILGERIKSNDFLAIVEGYATGASIRMATGWIVFIAFDAGNLRPVAVAVRERYPLAKIVLCADDDIDNQDNPGRTKATDAARAVGGIVIYPTWRSAT